MTFVDAISDERPVRSLSLEELTEELNLFCANKYWRGRYFAVNQEVQDRAARRWVREDVFGHTFTGSAEDAPAAATKPAKPLSSYEWEHNWMKSSR